MDPRHNRIMNLALAEKRICPRSLYPEKGSVYQDIVDAWRAGLLGAVPESLRKFEIADKKLSDPEYGEFVRLSRKFTCE